MTILFQGGELGAFVPSDGSVNESTLASYGSFDPAFARCFIGTTGGGSACYAESAEFTETAETYTHFEVTGPLGSSSTMVSFLDASNVVIATMTATASSPYTSWTLSMEYRNGGGVMTAIGTPFIMPKTRAPHDIYIFCDAAGGMKHYVSGTLRNSGSADLSHLDGVAKIRLHAGTFERHWSQVIVADEPTIGMRLFTMYPSGAGATSQFTGSYTAVDEIAYSDSDYIFSDTNGDVSVFAGTLVGALTGYTIRSVGVSARAKCGAGGPQNLRLVIRSGSTNYPNGSDIPLDVGYTANQVVWETDPDTTLDWTSVGASAIQFGVKAIT